MNDDYKFYSDEEKRNLVSADLSDSDCSIDENVSPTKSIQKESGMHILLYLPPPHSVKQKNLVK